MDRLILHSKDLNVYHVYLFAFASTLVYTIGLGIYRLYFHPLAKFPGPRSAALTKWVETYYEVFYKEGGQYYFVYKDWHKKYGPIVRISPDEVHIQDAAFYDTLYSNTKSFNKVPETQYRFGTDMSSFSTAHHSHHRKRRAALNPFFSRRKIAEHSPAVQKRMDRISERLRTDFMGISRVLGLADMWGCLTSDVVVEYCFGNTHDFIETPDFKAAYTQSVTQQLSPVHILTQFHAIAWITHNLPPAVVKWLVPTTAVVFKFNDDMTKQVQEILAARARGEKPDGKSTVFNALFEANLPPEELTLRRIHHEAISIVGAGVETTAKALTVTCFYLLDNPAVLQKLHEELDRRIPDADAIPHYDELAQFPYLSGVVEEGLRLAQGICERLPRVIAGSPLPYGDYVIPIGYAASMDIPDVLMDEKVFPDHETFRPERWMNDALAPDGRKLSRYMVSFSKGPRACVGLQLAYAELTIGLATIFRRFNLTLHDTTRASVEYHINKFVPLPEPGVHGVEIMVQSLRA